MVRSLRSLQGKKLQLCSIIGNHKIIKNTTQIELAIKLEGSTLVEVERQGKWIVMSFLIDYDTYCLYIHNGIYGTITHQLISGPIAYHKNDRFALLFTDVNCSHGATDLITYHDARCWGQIHLYSALDRVPFLKKNSIDALEITWQVYKEKYQKYRDLSLGDLLLRQDLVAGIGNIYRSEILHAARISPFRLPQDVSDSEWALLTTATHTILEQALEAGGSSISTYRLPNGMSGHAQHNHRVYKQQGNVCANCLQLYACKSIIKVELLTKRKIFFCEGCQI